MSIVRAAVVAAVLVPAVGCGGGTRLAGDATDGPSGDAPDAGDVPGSEALPDFASGDEGDGGVSDADAGRHGWVEVPLRMPHGLISHAAYDAARGVVVVRDLVGGRYGTWEYDGTSWREVVTPTALPDLNFGMTYDSARGVVVVVGDALDSSADLEETWEYDGTDWRQVATPSSPPARGGSAIAYDAARGVVVLFGGARSVGYGPHSYTEDLDDTWEYDGTDWRQVATPAAPAARSDHVMAYDSARAVVVLFGGGDYWGDDFAETWEYDGTGWTQTVPAGGTLPAVTFLGDVMTYDSARRLTLLYDGSATWEYDGASWREAVTPTVPAPRRDCALAYDSARGAAVLFGGLRTDIGEVLADTWEYDGTDWRETLPPTSPLRGFRPPMAYDSALGADVEFDGYVDERGTSASANGVTWEFRDGSWTRVLPPLSPVLDALGAMAYDSARGVAVLVGWAEVAGSETGETWEWDGASWREVATSDFPSLRDYFWTVYDSARRVVVLFGGSDATSPAAPSLADTWEYDGTAWTQARTPGAPRPRMEYAMAYDSARRVVVLFGGRHAATDTGCFGDTWEYDGVHWRQVYPAASPSAREGSAAAYDPVRHVVVLFGGAAFMPSGDGTYFDDTWEYDGTTWTQIPTTTQPPAMEDHTMTWDESLDAVVLFAGVTWEYFGP